MMKTYQVGDILFVRNYRHTNDRVFIKVIEIAPQFNRIKVINPVDLIQFICEITNHNENRILMNIGNKREKLFKLVWS